jgi:hypothetical protein
VAEGPGLRVALLADVDEIGIAETWSEPGHCLPALAGPRPARFLDLHPPSRARGGDELAAVRAGFDQQPG